MHCVDNREESKCEHMQNNCPMELALMAVNFYYANFSSALLITDQ
jgi:hypothetical protein